MAGQSMSGLEAIDAMAGKARQAFEKEDYG